jgi:hypothetical protein
MKLPEEALKMFARWGKKGGQATSDEKAKAARLNGQKGGRPSKKGGRPRKKAKRNG